MMQRRSFLGSVAALLSAPLLGLKMPAKPVRKLVVKSTSPFIPELWAKESLKLLQENMVMSDLVHRDFESTINTGRIR